MAKRKNPRRGSAPRKKPDALERAAKAIEQIAAREGSTPDMVRKHIQVAMMSGLLNDDPQVQAEWARIPKAGEVPTPEEVIAYYAAQVSGGNEGVAG